MPCSVEKLAPVSPLPRWSDVWGRLDSLAKSPLPNLKAPRPIKTFSFSRPHLVTDLTSLLSDEILLQILSKLPLSQRNPNFLVSKRWLNLQGSLVRSLKLLDWDFLLSGRLFLRFPNLVHVDLVPGSIVSPRNSDILYTHKLVSFHIDSDVCPNGLVPENYLLPEDEVDFGLKVLAGLYPNLRKLKVINASGMGLLSVAEECPNLQELELQKCNDEVLRGIAAFQNVQVLKLICNVNGFYESLVSDMGLTILAAGCGRLVKLELSGCEGSYEGIKAIGQCCRTLRELTITDHRMDGGWLSALSYCENLKILRFQSCKRIDFGSEADEHLGCCPALEFLHLEKCRLRDKQSLKSLFLICENVGEIVLQNCWGLDNDTFSLAGICRRVKSLSLEGCGLLTTEGLESVILSWKELQRIRVVSCNNIKDSDITRALSALFSDLKELKWRPDTKSLLALSLQGTSMGKKGGRIFKKS
ncbi:hypothetical protein NMG60_11012218 [Bertholletia excelsa]